jgi:hypothetical protein
MVRTFLKVYLELGSYFLFLQEQIKDIIVISNCCVSVLRLHCVHILLMATPSDFEHALHPNNPQSATGNYFLPFGHCLHVIVTVIC